MASNDEFYIDHGKRVDKKGRLILELDDRPWFLNTIVSFKAYAAVFWFFITSESLLQLYVAPSVWHLIVGLIGMYIGYMVHSSGALKKRNAIISVIYTFFLIMYNASLRKVIEKQILVKPTDSQTFAILMDVSLCGILWSSMALITYIIIQSFILQNGRSPSALFFLLIGLSLIWLPFPPYGFDFTQRFLRMGSNLVYRTS